MVRVDCVSGSLVCRGVSIILLCLFVIGKTDLYAHEQSAESQIEFVENAGQWKENVLYKADLSGGWLFLEQNQLTYLFLEASHHHHGESLETKTNHQGKDHEDHDHTQIKGHAYRTKWLGANAVTEINTEQSFSHHQNFFLGNDSQKWKSGVKSWKNIIYKEVYDYIDFKMYSQGSTLKSDYIVRKGGNPYQILVEYDGVDAISIDENGRLHISTSVNEVYEFKPYSYQFINGIQQEVKTEYVLNGNKLSFAFPDGYDTNQVLIIDPTLVFSTYSGSVSDNWGASSTHDSKGNMYLGGIARGADYPVTVGAFQTTFGGAYSTSSSTGCDVVITKFASDGKSRLYSTYLGGSSNELLSSLYSTEKDELIVLMATSSSNFPIGANAYQSNFRGGSNVTMMGTIIFPNGSDIAVVKLSKDGSALIGGTYYGGTANDGLNLGAQLNYNYGDESRGDIAVDKAGNIYIVSSTTSTNLTGTAGSVQPTRGGDFDGLLAKFNADLSQLHWATYYGGASADAAYSVQLDAEENVYIAGGTRSGTLIGTVNGLNPTHRGGLADGYVAKISKDGKSVLSATYLGTSQHDQAQIMDLDKNGFVYVFGQTLGSYPVTSGVYSNPGSTQFIHKLSPDLKTTVFSTVFGRPNYNYINISPTAFMVDVCENIYAVGWGGKTNENINRRIGYTNGMPVTADAFMSTTDGSDFYLINLSKDAKSLKYATFFGEMGANDHVDGGTSRFDKNGVVYQSVCASCTGRNGFPVTPDAYGTSNLSANCNMAGFKFKFDIEAMQIIQLSAEPDPACKPLTKSFSYTSTQAGTTYSWDFGDGKTSTEQYPSHTYALPGTYQVKFILVNPDNCNPIDSAFLTVEIFSDSVEIQKELCAGSIFELDGQQYDKAGRYEISYKDQFGCDSIIVLNLSFLSFIEKEIKAEICHGSSFIFHGKTITTSGNYTETLLAESGCDSIVRLTLIVLPEIRKEQNYTICKGNSYTVGANVYTAAGTYTDILPAVSGCDSIVVTHLSLTDKLENFLGKSICEGSSYVFNGKTITTSGEYSETFLSANGCDSIVHLTLHVSSVIREEKSISICRGSSYTVGENIYTESGIYTDAFTSAFGCDSVVVTHLEVKELPATSVQVSICEGEKYEWDGIEYNFPGIYSRNFTAENGCDSIVTLHLEHLPVRKTEQNITICFGENYTVGDNIYTVTGTYSDTLLSDLGCDSIVTTHLLVENIPVINLGADTSVCSQILLTPGDVSWQYVWQDGSTPHEYLVKETGTYWATATNECGTHTDSVYVEVELCDCDVFFPGAFSPNGDGVNDRFGGIEQGAVQTMLNIYNRWGELVFESKDSSLRWDGQYKGIESPMDGYVYYYEGICENGKSIQRRGVVTLIR